MKIYPDVWRTAKDGYPEKVITKERFKETLSPLTWVDWIDPEIKATYGGSGERPRTALRIWLISAIKNKQTFGQEEVMSKTVKSKPGRGILAPVGKGNITMAGSREWPYKGRPIELIAHQPSHALPTSTWTVIDSNDNDYTEHSDVVARNGTATMILRWSPWMDKIKQIHVSVTWRNTISPAAVSKITLQRR